MDEALAMLSLHCPETEFEQLCSALAALEDGGGAAAAAAAAALARRYLERIGDLSQTQRALLESAVALHAHGESAAVCRAAHAAFGSMLRKLRRL
jgi:hypothetical protein